MKSNFNKNLLSYEENLIINNRIKNNLIKLYKFSKIENNKLLVFPKIFEFEDEEIIFSGLEEEFIDDLSIDNEEEELIWNFNKLYDNIVNSKIVKNKKNNKVNLNLVNNNQIINLIELKYEHENCLICFKKYKIDHEILLIKNCNHFFHFKCLSKWIIIKIYMQCPICKN